MAIQRWDPFGEMLSLRSAMDRLFEDAWVRPSAATGQQGGSMAMPLDLYEKDDNLVIRASLPGVKPEDVNITVQGNTLTIEGEMRMDEQHKGNVRHQEHRYGRFFRSVTLPARVDADKADASFEHGVVTLTLPKEAAARTRQIPLRSQPAAMEAQGAPAGNGAEAKSKAAGATNGTKATAATS
jgi:HSP20 family protein